MSTDRGRRAYHKIATAMGMGAAIVLAGCSEADPTSDASVDDSSNRDEAESASELTEPEDSAPPDTDSSESQVGPTGENCDDATLNALMERKWGLEDQLFELEFQLSRLLTNDRATRYLVEILESGFPPETLERGREVGLAARESVVTLQILQDGFPANHATAWFVDDGYLFTNAHNVYTGFDVSDVRGLTKDGRTFDIEVVDFVAEMHPDIALLRTDFRDPPTLPLADVDELDVGQPLIQVGHPGEVGYWIISMGRFVDARSEIPFDDDDEFTVLDSVVPGTRGVSGSPVMTLDGEVVGMTKGGQPFGNRQPGEPAPVAPAYVFDGPIGNYVLSNHDGSDVLMQKLEEWR